MCNPLSRRSFYSFCGTRHLAETASVLLGAAARDGQPAELRLIAEDAADGLAALGFRVEPDRDHFDYRLDVAALAEMRGNDLVGKRLAANRFARRHAPTIRRLELTDTATRLALLALRPRWAGNPNQPGTDPQLWSNGQDADWPALERLLAAAEHFDLLGLGVMVADELAGFYLAEIGRDGAAFGHFLKADHRRFPGSTEMLAREVACGLRAAGCRWINYGSDDGLPGLRQNKLLYRPIGFVEKFAVRPPTRHPGESRGPAPPRDGCPTGPRRPCPGAGRGPG